MIKTFKHSGLKRYFTKGSPKGIPPKLVDRIRIRLNALDRAKALSDMNLSGFDFHPLKGDRAGRYAVTVTKNYWIVFRFKDNDAFDVDLEDYR